MRADAIIEVGSAIARLFRGKRKKKLAAVMIEMRDVRLHLEALAALRAKLHTAAASNQPLDLAADEVRAIDATFDAFARLRDHLRDLA